MCIISCAFFRQKAHFCPDEVVNHDYFQECLCNSEWDKSEANVAYANVNI